MNSFDCIIIGSGLGGLTAGALLSKKGKRILVIEQHNIPGGCATTYMRKGCKFEVGLHKMDGLDNNDIKREIFEKLEVFKDIKFVKSPDFYRFVSKDFSLVIPDNYLDAIKELGEKYPADKKGIKKFFTTLINIRDQINNLCRLSPFMQKVLFPIYPFIFPAIFFNMNRTVWSFLSKCVKNVELKNALLANLIFYHDDPETMSLLYYSAAQGSYLKGGGHFIQGGSQELSNSLVRTIEKNEGQVIYKSLVTKILTENGAAIGIEYNSANGESKKAYAKYIIANAAVPNVVNDLLPKEDAVKLKRKIQGLENAISLFTVSVIFNKSPKEFGITNYSTFISNKIGYSSEEIKNMHKAGFKDRNFFLCDYSQIDSKLAPEGKYFGVLCCADYLTNWENMTQKEYKNSKDEAAQVLIKRLNDLYPNIKDSIEYYEVATAKTLKKYILTPGGTAYGFAQTVKQAVPWRLSNKSPIKNLYFASAWVFPGGGFTGVIMSGNNCAAYIK